MEIKHVAKLATLDALLKAVKTSCVRTIQGRTCLIKRRLFRWLLLHTYYKINRVVGHGVIRANGSWITLDPPAPKISILPPPLTTTQQLMLMLVCLLGKFACIYEYFSFCANKPFSLHFTQGYSLGFL